MTLFTIFDLASLTKPVVTASLAVKLAEHGLWSLDEPVKTYIPDFCGKNKEFVTIRHLLTHTSGLPDWKHFFAIERNRSKILSRIFRSRLLAFPGQKVIYSCPGYILLGVAIEEVTGTTLDILAKEWLFAPLKMCDTMFCPSHEVASRIAATEYHPFLGRVLIGEVHEGSAWMMGGVAGNAGLFSTAIDLARFAQMLLEMGRLKDVRTFSPRSVTLMTTVAAEDEYSRYGLGWRLGGTRFMGDLVSRQAFGHTGYTGTSLLIDPELQIIVIFLTNRVHPFRTLQSKKINCVISKLHNIIVASII